MSASFEIESSTGKYGVRIQRGALKEFLQPAKNQIIICDEFFEQTFEKAGVPFVAVRADEQQKSLEAVPDLIQKLRALGCTRSTRLVAVGGGIVQDVAAFCATIYMRGVPWTYAPTTLLGMVDSCIGGKSSINVAGMKNIVGTFYPPTEVVIDPDVTSSLADEQWAAGLCEAAKIAYCKSDEAFSEYMALVASVRSHGEVLARLIELSLRCKKWFIEVDEFDKGDRLLLNFGHTFGHGLESASHYDISHGVAVGVGILAALRFGESMGVQYGSARELARFEAHIREVLSGAPSLRGHLRKIESDKVVSSIAADKKHTPTHFTFVTVRDDGRVELRRVEKTDDSRTRLKIAVDTSIAGLVA